MCVWMQGSCVRWNRLSANLTCMARVSKVNNIRPHAPRASHQTQGFLNYAINTTMARAGVAMENVHNMILIVVGT